MKNPVEVIEMQFLDRRGVRTLAWGVYYNGRLYSLEYTFGYSLLTLNVEFAAPLRAVA